MYSKADGSFDTVTDDALLIVIAFYERGNNFANIIEKNGLVNDTTKKLSALVTKYDIEIKAGRGKPKTLIRARIAATFPVFGALVCMNESLRSIVKITYDGNDLPPVLRCGALVNMCHDMPKKFRDCVLLSCAFVQGQVLGVIGGKNKPKFLHTAIKVAARVLKRGLECKLWPHKVCLKKFRYAGLAVVEDTRTVKAGQKLAKWARMSAQAIKNKTQNYRSALSGDVASMRC